MRCRPRKSPALAPLAALAAATCIPSLGPGDSLVTSPRILAVRADPAEASPGTSVTFTSFVVDASGTLAAARVVWDFCTAPLPLTEDNVVSNACLDSSSVVTAGVGGTATTKTPAKGCSLFGPDTPPGGFRPPDPDATGGYYQPLRAELAGAEAAFALARIHCDLADASAATATAFAAAYTLNQNPVLLPLTATIGGSGAALTAVPAGATLELSAGWPASSAETFAYYDPTSATVTTRRESMQVAWYSTAGALQTEATGRSSTDHSTTSPNAWTAPSTPGVSHLFVVLRDSRGGVDFADTELTVVVR